MTKKGTDMKTYDQIMEDFQKLHYSDFAIQLIEALKKETDEKLEVLQDQIHRKEFKKEKDMTIEIVDKDELTNNLPTIMDQIRDLKVEGIKFNHFDSFKILLGENEILLGEDEILLGESKVLTIETMNKDDGDCDNCGLNVYVKDKPDNTWIK